MSNRGAGGGAAAAGLAVAGCRAAAAGLAVAGGGAAAAGLAVAGCRAADGRVAAAAPTDTTASTTRPTITNRCFSMSDLLFSKSTLNFKVHQQKKGTTR
jgi:hypothetical protein